jgi:hypothetical protein
VVDEVGEDKVLFAPYETVPKDDVDAWLDKFYTYVEPAPEEE